MRFFKSKKNKITHNLQVNSKDRRDRLIKDFFDEEVNEYSYSIILKFLELTDFNLISEKYLISNGYRRTKNINELECECNMYVIRMSEDSSNLLIYNEDYLPYVKFENISFEITKEDLKIEILNRFPI